MRSQESVAKLIKRVFALELVGFPVLSRFRDVEAFWMGLFSMAFDKIKTVFLSRRGKSRGGGGGGGLPSPRFPLGVIIDS